MEYKEILWFGFHGGFIVFGEKLCFGEMIYCSIVLLFLVLILQALYDFLLIVVDVKRLMYGCLD
jgi:hypothetical protein